MIADLLPGFRPTASPTVVTFDVLVDGNLLPAEFSVVSIVTDRSVDRIPTASVILVDGNPAKQNFPASESSELRPGTRLEVRLGYQGSNESVFGGEITGQRIKVRPGHSLLVVTVKDPVYRMTLLRRSRQFTDISDAEAFENILSEAGLEYAVDASVASSPSLVQHRCTDWDFLVTRAQVNGLVTLVDNGAVTVKEPEIGKAVGLVEYGRNLLSFDGEIDVRTHFGEYEATGWDLAAEEVGTGSASTVTSPLSGDFDPVNQAGEHGQSPFLTAHGGPAATGELTALTNGQSVRSSLSRFRGVAEIEGTHLVVPGNTVDLLGLGEAYNGKAYVSGVRQEVSSGRWSTFLQLGLDEERFTEQHDISTPPAAGLIAAVPGLQLGRVLQLAGDPQGEGRILISTPAIAPDGEGQWARLATLTAGNESGITFRPAIDEEVIVGYFDDDPRYPVILGSLHGGRRPSQIEADDSNAQTGIQTVGGHRLLFDDEADTITVSNAAGAMVVLDGAGGEVVIADQNGNTITMSGSGIEIKSAGNLTLSANGSLEATAGSNAKLEGSAGSEITSPAITTVKGSLVQIN